MSDDAGMKNKLSFTVINTNARSLCPKINSLIDCFADMSATIGIVTETWLSDGESLDEDIEGLCLGAGMGMLCRNRPVNNRGFSHGGVAIVSRESEVTLKRMKLHNPWEYEVLMATGMLRGSSRRVVVVAAYIPPNYTVGRGRGAMELVAGAVSEAKRKFDDPLIVLAGDFNQWKVEDYLRDFPDLLELPVGNTRGDHCIDRMFGNFNAMEVGTLPPLETDPGSEAAARPSDHRIAFCRTSLPRVRPYELMTYTYRYYSKEGEEEYGRWLAGKDWSHLLGLSGSNAKTEYYQREVVGAMERIFPLITVKRRSSDPPWYNWRIRKMIKQKRGIYKREGRSPKWRRMKKLLESLVERRREKYAGSQKDALLASDGQRNFFKNVRNYRSAEKPPPFDVIPCFRGSPTPRWRRY